MPAVITKIIKDVCTLKNGEDYCIAGIIMLIGLAAGCVFLGIGIYFAWGDIDKLCKLMQNIAIYNGGLVTTGGAGKMMTNQAEDSK